MSRMSVIKTKYKSKSLVYNFIYPEFLAILHFCPREDKPILVILIVFSQMKKGTVHQHWKLYFHIAPFVSRVMHIFSDKLKILLKKYKMP